MTQTAETAAPVEERERPDYDHPFRMSSLPRLRYCPGSFHLAQAAGPRVDTQSDAAAEGTQLHEVCARLLEWDGDQPRELYDIDALTKEGESLDGSQYWAVTQCLTWVDDEVERANEKYGVDLLPYMVEDETSIFRDGSTQLLSRGTVDYALIGRTHDGKTIIMVVDWKFGRSSLDPQAATMQLLGYSLGLMQALSVEDREACTVLAWINQPRCDGLFSGVFTGAQYDEMLKVVVDTVEAAQAADAAINPCLAACRYCPAIGHCQAAQEIHKIIPKTVDPVVLMDNAALAKCKEAHKIEQVGAAALDTVIKSRMASRAVIPGWKPQQRKGKTVFSDNKRAAHLLGDKVATVDMLRTGGIKLGDIPLEMFVDSKVTLTFPWLLEHSDIPVSKIRDMYVAAKTSEENPEKTTKKQALADFESDLEEALRTSAPTTAIVRDNTTKAD